MPVCTSWLVKYSRVFAWFVCGCGDLETVVSGNICVVICVYVCVFGLLGACAFVCVYACACAYGCLCVDCF